LAIPVRIVAWNPRVVEDDEDFAIENPVHSSDTYQGFDAAIHTSGCQMKNTGLGKDRFPSLG
jgi:hypothetical protein